MRSTASTTLRTPSSRTSGGPATRAPHARRTSTPLNLNICENLYGTPDAVKAPYFAYGHKSPVFAGETCPVTGGLDHGPNLLQWRLLPRPIRRQPHLRRLRQGLHLGNVRGNQRVTGPAKLETFVTGASNPVDLEIGPGGDLFYVDFGGGTIRRVQFFGGNRPPKAVATADPTNGPTPLTVDFDGTVSSDSDPGDTLTYAWDLDGDGAFDDSDSPQPSYTYATAGNYDVQLRVTDSQGASDTLDTPITVSPGNTPPAAVMDASPLDLAGRR